MIDCHRERKPFATARADPMRIELTPMTRPVHQRTAAVTWIDGRVRLDQRDGASVGLR